MATAKRSKTVATLASDATDAESSVLTGALHFAVYQENSGRHRWRLTTSDGQDLATSCASYATHDEAQHAAGASRR
jgi:uncharacterized protein YegP (UPF0339 family)